MGMGDERDVPEGEWKGYDPGNGDLFRVLRQLNEAGYEKDDILDALEEALKERPADERPSIEDGVSESESEAVSLCGEMETEDHHAEIMADSGRRSLTVMEASGKLPAAMTIVRGGRPGHTLTPYETLLILSRCMEYVTHTSLGLLVGVYADLQIAELCALRWRDIDLDTGMIHIHQKLLRENGPVGTEAGSKLVFREAGKRERWIAIYPDIFPILAQWKEDAAEEEFLLRDKLPHEPKNAAKYFRKLTDRIGVFGVTYRGLQGGWKQLAKQLEEGKVPEPPGTCPEEEPLPEMEEEEKTLEYPGAVPEDALLSVLVQLEHAGFSKDGLLDILQTMERMKVPGKGNYGCPEICFGDVVTEWFADKSGQMRPATISRYRALLRKDLFSEWDRLPLSAITQEMYDGLIDRISEKCGRSDLMCANVIIKNAVKYGVSEGYLRVPPFTANRVDTAWKGGSIRRLDTSELDQIIRYCRIKDTKITVGILLMLYEGISLSELCALQWKDIDLERDSIHVHHALLRVSLDGTKTKTRLIFQPVRGGDRTLPVHPAVRARLAHWKGKMLPDHYVIRDENYYEPRNAARVIKGEDAFAGIPDFKCSMLRQSAPLLADIEKDGYHGIKKNTVIF